MIKFIRTTIAFAALAGCITASAGVDYNLHGTPVVIDTVFHAKVGPGTTQSQLRVTGGTKLDVFYVTIDRTTPGVSIKAACATIRLIWSPKMVTQPEVTSFHTKLRTDAGKVVLANSITMTPGTITVDVRDDLFLIHCLDDSFDVGQEGFDMEERVMKLEGGHNHD